MTDARVSGRRMDSLSTPVPARAASVCSWRTHSESVCSLKVKLVESAGMNDFSRRLTLSGSLKRTLLTTYGHKTFHSDRLGDRPRIPPRNPRACEFCEFVIIGIHEITIVRGHCELSSLAPNWVWPRSPRSGWMFPRASIARETMTCEPAPASGHGSRHKLQAYSPPLA